MATTRWRGGYDSVELNDSDSCMGHDGEFGSEGIFSCLSFCIGSVSLPWDSCAFGTALPQRRYHQEPAPGTTALDDQWSLLPLICFGLAALRVVLLVYSRIALDVLAF